MKKNSTNEREVAHIIDQHIHQMRQNPSSKNSKDILIISTNSIQQEIYWERRLEETKKFISKENSLIIAVYEDWQGGAGNGLGTLYAYLKAEKKALQTHGIHLRQEQKQGASITVYHTAGKGTRIAPLSLSESNNKSNIKLPELLPIKEGKEPITILETVIRQTSIYSTSRPGRLSVFWGDQIFIPSKPSKYTPKHHIDILVKYLPKPDRLDWEKKKLDKYGLILTDINNNSRQVEKINYDTFLSLLPKNPQENSSQVGISLGSFSLSFSMTQSLLDEFSKELTLKEGSFNSDQDFWMPLTLDYPTFSLILQKKGAHPDSLKKHYERMQNFKTLFCQKTPESSLFSAVDVGNESYWCDYGLLSSYVENILLLTNLSHKAKSMRSFFGHIAPSPHQNTIDSDDTSLILNSSIAKGRIRNSVLVGVQAEHVDISNAIVINTSAKKIKGTHFLAYCVKEDGFLHLQENSVRADTHLAKDQQHIKFFTTIDSNGSKDWKERLAKNPFSYEEFYKANLREYTNIA